MDCREAILSNDYADFIYGFQTPAAGEPDFPKEFCTQKIAVGLGVYYAERSRIPPLDVQFYNYSSFPKLYTTLDTSSMEASGILRLVNQPVLNLDGREVLIGFIDTGERVIIMSS